MRSSGKPAAHHRVAADLRSGRLRLGFRACPSAATSLLAGFGNACLEDAERTGSRAEIDSALARADSLIEAAAAILSSGKYPAQASVVCYEKGRLARIHRQIAVATASPVHAPPGGESHASFSAIVSASTPSLAEPVFQIQRSTLWPTGTIRLTGVR